MNLFAVSGLLVGTSNLLLGILVFLNNRKSRANQIYLLFAAAVTIWGFGGLKIGSIPYGEKELAYFWWRITLVGVIFIPIFFLHFVYLWLGIKKKWMIVLAYIQGFFFLGINIYELITISGGGLFLNLKWLFNSFYWPVSIPLGLYGIFVFIWLFIALYPHYDLLKMYKKEGGIKRAQIKYFLLGTLLGYSGGGTCHIPVFGIPLYPYFNFTVAMYPIFTYYAIAKYRFMDIRTVIGKAGIYILSFVSIFLYVLSLFYLNYRLKIFSSLIFNFFTVITAIPLFYYSLQFFEKIATKYFYYTVYSLQESIKELGKKLNKTIELDKLIELINHSLMNALKLERIGTIVREPEKKTFKPQKVIGFSRNEIISLLDREGNFFLKYLEKTKDTLLREEIPFLTNKLKEEKEKKNLEILRKAMEQIGIAVFLPLLLKEELIGIIVLGDKLSREAYSVQDLDLLSTFASQASVAINNALSYFELEKRKAEIEKFLKLTIDRELKMIELKKEVKKLKKESDNN